ncbi:MAG: N-acetylmuramoyl-L-alanine amidase [Chloroflexaceae bacterium]|nr:N-acetylmuramoyl-L-alanine amidase [Chloroflexaceae bacterium]
MLKKIPLQWWVAIALTALLAISTYSSEPPKAIPPAPSQGSPAVVTPAPPPDSTSDRLTPTASLTAQVIEKPKHPQPLLDYSFIQPNCGIPIPYQGSGPIPKEESAPAHPSNYGPRYQTDADGRFLSNQLLIVLHETVGTASSAIHTFKTPHHRDRDQVSYHQLIRRNGAIVNIVPLEWRAFGAGNSVFRGPWGDETAKTSANLPPSVNNFAYHISLESPPDNGGSAATHKGYTDAQYESLAWLIARSCLSDRRVTTHKAVDRSGSRRDPRSFDGQKLLRLLNQYPERYGAALP